MRNQLILVREQGLAIHSLRGLSTEKRKNAGK
jgi:hypothetical protein